MKKQMLWIVLLASAASIAASAETINAAGATFPAPIYQKWFEEFHKAHPDIQINYQAIGSGGGIRQLTEGTVDFGASDMPMTDEQLSKVTKYKVLHFPTVLGGIVPTYNVAGAAPEVFGRHARRHLSRHNQEVERSGAQKDNPGRIFPTKTSPWSIARMAAAPASFSPTIFRR
jgi:DNA-binding transcriptional LysR family regulator